MQKSVVSVRVEKGFTLIELLIVVAIIGILAAIAIPGYIGMQDKSRRGAISRSATSVLPELQAWMMAARSVEDIVEIDTNFNGTIETLGTRVDPDDLSNAHLRAAGVAPTYVNKRLTAMQEISPWSSSIPLWVNNDADTQGTDINMAGVINIVSTTMSLRVIARGKEGSILINRIVSAD